MSDKLLWAAKSMLSKLQFTYPDGTLLETPELKEWMAAIKEAEPKVIPKGLTVRYRRCLQLEGKDRLSVVAICDLPGCYKPEQYEHHQYFIRWIDTEWQEEQT